MSQRLSKILTVALLTVSLAQVTLAQSEIQPEKRAAILQLMAVTGAADLGEQMSQVMAQQMTIALRNARPDIPARAFDIVNEEVQSAMSTEIANGSFEELVTPLYDKYFSISEIRELLAFYETEIGRKTIAVMPQLTQESMALGQSWGASIGAQIGQRITRRLAEEGIEVDL